MHEQLSENIKRITTVRAVLPFPFENSGKILLIQRSGSNKMHAGEFELPGGKTNENDTDMVETAIREIEEESGFVVKIAGNTLSRIDRYVINDGSARDGQLFTAYAGVARYITGELRLSEAHDDALWVNPLEIADFNVTRATLNAVVLYNNLTLGIKDAV